MPRMWPTFFSPPPWRSICSPAPEQGPRQDGVIRISRRSISKSQFKKLFWIYIFRWFSKFLLFIIELLLLTSCFFPSFNLYSLNLLVFRISPGDRGCQYYSILLYFWYCSNVCDFVLRRSSIIATSAQSKHLWIYSTTRP